MMLWLAWMIREYGLRHLDVKNFSNVDGKELCTMGLQDVMQKTTPYNAEVLMQNLKCFKQGLLALSYLEGGTVPQPPLLLTFPFCEIEQMLLSD